MDIQGDLPGLHRQSTVSSGQTRSLAKPGNSLLVLHLFRQRAVARRARTSRTSWATTSILREIQPRTAPGGISNAFSGNPSLDAGLCWRRSSRAARPSHSGVFARTGGKGPTPTRARPATSHDETPERDRRGRRAAGEAHTQVIWCAV